jgi:hypothetical protein
MLFTFAFGTVACGGDDAREDAGRAPVVIQPTDDAAAVVAGSPPGTSFEFATGVHRGVFISPRRGDSFTAQPGAVLSGAVVVSEFTRSGSVWVAPGPAGSPPIGECRPDRPACALPEELFLDGRPLTRVVDRSGVGPGTWTLEPATTSGADASSTTQPPTTAPGPAPAVGPPSYIVMGDAPDGRLVELSVVPSAIDGSASDVTVSGVYFEHYANPAGRGVVHMEPGASNWRVEDCTVRDSHGEGVVVRDHSTIDDCWLEGNGQQGLGGQGAAITVQDSVIVRNNRAGFSPGWSAGGAKFALTSGLRVQRNVVLANDGPGLWTDIDCVDTIYADNLVENNSQAGIQHEISGPATITGNRVTGNGSGSSGWLWGAGIQVVNSDGVTVRGNQLQANRQGIVGVDQDRGAGDRGERQLRDLTVEGNWVVDSGQTGVVQDHGDADVYTRGQRFEGNRYEGAVSWGWLDAEVSWPQWQAAGHDLTGSYLP